MPRDKKHEITVSLIVAVYNVEKYISECLDSIAVQEQNGLEIIIVNDGSTDLSGDICATWAKQRKNVLLINQANGGLSSARNAALSLAKGEYTYFLDGDDCLEAEAISTLLQFAEQTKCDIVQGGFFYLYSSRKLLDERFIKRTQDPFILSQREAMDSLVRGEFVKDFAWGKLYRTSLIRGVPFPFGRCFEDVYWQYLVIGKASRYGVTPFPVQNYRQRSGSLSGEFSLRFIDLLEGYEARLTYLSENMPLLTSLQVKRLWSLSLYCRILSEKRGDQELKPLYSAFWKNMHKKYAPLLFRALWNCPKFWITKYFYPLIYPYLWIEKAFLRVFGKRMTIIK